jgi:hypothetical protein
MSRSRWQAVLAACTVVVGAATSVVTNLVTQRWSAPLSALLAAFVVAGVLLAVRTVRSSQAEAAVRQSAKASGNARVVQIGGSVQHVDGPGQDGIRRRGR